MAQRRMFSLKIVDTDAFLEMPLSSQALYFHLAMRADDDGFVSNPKKIMRMLGSQDDDFKVLLTKRFILPFDNGICVIKHWRIHNYIQSDRYQETPYLEQKASIILKENGSYTECIQNVSKMDTQVRLGKDRLDTVKRDTFGEHKNVFLTSVEFDNLVSALGEQPTENLIAELSSYMASTGRKYKSHYATLQNWARRRIQEHRRLLAKPKGKGLIT